MVAFIVAVGVTLHTSILQERWLHNLKVVPRPLLVELFTLNLYVYCLVWLYVITKLCTYMLERWFVTLYLRPYIPHRILLCRLWYTRLSVHTRSKSTFLPYLVIINCTDSTGIYNILHRIYLSPFVLCLHIIW